MDWRLSSGDPPWTWRSDMAEVIVLPVGIPGIGRKGDYVVSDPDHPNPNYRLARFGVLEPELLPSIKARISRPSQKEKSAVGM